MKMVEVINNPTNKQVNESIEKINSELFKLDIIFSDLVQKKLPLPWPMSIGGNDRQWRCC